MSLTVSTVDGLARVAPSAWDALAGPDNPFVEHAFLAALEATGCVGADAGWLPAHVLIHDDGALVGAAPLYVKDHSQGEYIFDWSWAQACQRARVPYYPKVVCAVPFVPATGPRLLVAPGADPAVVRGAIAAGARDVADAVGASSVHWLFVRPDEAPALGALGFRPRLSYQFHWEDRGFGDWEGFLAALTSKRRKEVRRERRQASSGGLDLAVEPVAGWPERDLDALYRCYVKTVDEHGWNVPYLTRRFFLELPERLGHRAVVATARRGGALVAGALAFRKGPHLYGRHWGSLVDVPALHFELSYHQLVAWALGQGITRFEAGAQGPHKVARGFLPVLTHSAHWLRHPGLDRAVADFLDQEALHVRREVAAWATHAPYRERDDDGGSA